MPKVLSMNGLFGCAALVGAFALVALLDLILFPHTPVLSLWLLVKVALLPLLGIIAFAIFMKWLLSR